MSEKNANEDYEPNANNINYLSSLALTTSSSPSITSKSLNKQQVLYELDVLIKEGTNLLVANTNDALSECYVKLFLNGITVFKSKSVNILNKKCIWNETTLVKLGKLKKKENDFTNLNIFKKIPKMFRPRVKSNGSIADEKYNRSSSISNVSMTSQSTISLNESTNILEQKSVAGLLLLSIYKLNLTVYNRNDENIIGKLSIDLELRNKNVQEPDKCGLISLDITLNKKLFFLNNIQEHNDEHQLTVTSVNSLSKLSKDSLPHSRRTKKCVVTINLIEVTNLISMDDNGTSDPYVILKIQNEKYRSKTVTKSLNPKYLERFLFHIHDDSQMTLHLTVHDFDLTKNDDYLGSAHVDLSKFERDKTHHLKIPLDYNCGFVNLLLTISGLAKQDVEDNIGTISNVNFDNIVKKYSLLNSFRNLNDIGWLQVKIYKAEGLASADFNGKSDPFCIVRLGNQCVQTHTEYKTLNPIWNRTFEFKVTDVDSVLVVTILDEDNNGEIDFLGRVAIPILNIKNNSKKYYALKDKRLKKRAKGIIKIETNLVFNKLKAMVKTFGPKEEVYKKNVDNSFKLALLQRNLKKILKLTQSLLVGINFLDTSLNWTNPIQSFATLFGFILVTWFIELYMIPLGLFLFFIINYLSIVLRPKTSDFENFSENYEEKEEESNPTKELAKISLLKQPKEMEQVALKLQYYLDQVITFGEKLSNLATFKTPWYSWLVVIILAMGIVVCFFVPLRYLILIYGISKFTEKFHLSKLGGNYASSSSTNNGIRHFKLLSYELSFSKSILENFLDTHLVNFFNRVPSKKDLFHYRELRTVIRSHHHKTTNVDVIGES